MVRDIIFTSDAPEAIGPYSQGIATKNLVFCSGQIPMDPKTGKIVNDSITEQTKQCLKNLRGVLEAAGSSLSQVLKVTVFLKDMDDFVLMNKEYANWFTENPPARAAVEVSRLPKDVDIEIQAIAQR